MKLKLYFILITFLTMGNVFSHTSRALTTHLDFDKVESCAELTALTTPPTSPAVQGLQIYAGTATLADLTATGTNLQWYAFSYTGNPLPLTTTLVDGSTYYVSQTVEGVESVRAAVIVKKISEASQTLCNGATLANLTTTPFVNGIVEWFTDETGGTALVETAVLESGTYFVEQTPKASVILNISFFIPAVFNS